MSQAFFDKLQDVLVKHDGTILRFLHAHRHLDSKEWQIDSYGSDSGLEWEVSQGRLIKFRFTAEICCQSACYRFSCQANDAYAAEQLLQEILQLRERMPCFFIR